MRSERVTEVAAHRGPAGNPPEAVSEGASVFVSWQLRALELPITRSLARRGNAW
jgi:hypothetical protein